MRRQLVKEALVRLAHNWQLNPPHMRKTPYKVPQPAWKTPGTQNKSFGFSVPVRQTDNYYFGNPAAIPAGQYRYVASNNGVKQVKPIDTSTNKVNNVMGGSTNKVTKTVRQ